jgi:hypothetical protein
LSKGLQGGQGEGSANCGKTHEDRKQEETRSGLQR